MLKSASTDFKKLGQRIFVFIIGGATRSEVYIQNKSDLMSELMLCFFIKYCVNIGQKESEHNFLTAPSLPQVDKQFEERSGTRLH